MKTTPQRIARLTQADIDAALETLVADMSTAALLNIPGVRELLHEALNNEAIDAALASDEQCCEECNEWIPHDEPAPMNEWHAEDCSLYTRTPTRTRNMITADTITDEQICELRARAHGDHFTNRNDSMIELCDIARGWVLPDVVDDVRAARARCAEILNARAVRAGGS